MSDTVVVRDDGVLEVHGHVTFQTVPEFLSQAGQWLNRSEPSRITMDLGRVAHIDTAGIALMLEWLTQAQAQQRELKFVNLPDQMRHFIGVSGLNTAFGLA